MRVGVLNICVKLRECAAAVYYHTSSRYFSLNSLPTEKGSPREFWGDVVGIWRFGKSKGSYMKGSSTQNGWADHSVSDGSFSSHRT